MFNAPRTLTLLLVTVAACGGNESWPVPPDPAGLVLADVPTGIDPTSHYLFYLHGRIIEEEGVRPTHPEWVEPVVEWASAAG